MQASSLRATGLSLLLLAASCGGTQTSSGDGADGAGTATAAATAEPASTGADPAATASATSGAATATPSASGKPATTSEPAAKGVAKDENALVVEMLFAMKGGGSVDDTTKAELIKAAEARIAQSPKIASKGAKVAKPRAVTMTIMLDKPVTDKAGLTVHMGITGVEQNGKCPLFDLSQKFSMSGGKNDAADVLELRKNAIAALIEKLEVSAPTLKPDANCTSFKGPGK